MQVCRGMVNLFDAKSSLTEHTALTTSKLSKNCKWYLKFFTIWVITTSLCLLLPFIYGTPKPIEFYKEKYIQKLPSINWYNSITSTTTKITWTTKERKIGCFNNSKFFRCKILAKESKEEADAYLFYGAAIDRFPLPKGQKIWGLLHDETPVSKLILMYDEGLSLFNFSATFSRHSDVPLPLLWFRGVSSVTSTKYFVNTSKKNALLSEIAPVMYMQSHCDTLLLRDDYVTRLMKYIKIDSYGYCIHNKELPLNPVLRNSDKTKLHFSQLYDEELLEFMAKYKFVVAIESAVCNDYVTEKFWRAIELGVVPIYYGSPLIRDWLPNNKSAILLEDFPTLELLSRHLHYLLSNDTAYEEYLEHKTIGQISNQELIDEINARPYQTDIEEVVKKFECFICEQLYKNSSNVNTVTIDHYNCPIVTENTPIEASKQWIGYKDEAKILLNTLFMEMKLINSTHPSEISCIDNVYIWKMVFDHEV